MISQKRKKKKIKAVLMLINIILYYCKLKKIKKNN